MRLFDLMRPRQLSVWREIIRIGPWNTLGPLRLHDSMWDGIGFGVGDSLFQRVKGQFDLLPRFHHARISR